ncbi:Bifunctional dTDP-4-dehydrorhamnose 3,5-epimerase/dTDP-4-dehydrorhamnose reductase [Spatholobus suberectus]|nr:Bifunctional dTDP-4-dehydrorhamnose 3,5-epimerase/dTDP-4-dehydrorhamnose reductase [Spatholobus suberectus]
MGAEANGGEKQLKFLIYGRTGWIGGLLGKVCEERGIPYEYGTGRLENRLSLEADITAVKPSHVFNCGGCHGQTQCGLVRISQGRNHPKQRGRHSHPRRRVPPARPRPHQLRHRLHLRVEDLLRNYENVCTLRVRMPISSDLSNPRNFITKITRYDKVVDIPNSMTILDELLPLSLQMAERNLTGIWNFTNPGVVSHNEILQMYREFVDPNFTWKNFTLEEQAKIIVAPRSNNELDASKLKKEFPELLSIKDSLIKYVFQPNQKKGCIL